MKRKLLTELDRDMVISQIKRLELKKVYTVEITERRIKRTISQNGLYWLWLTCISHETGNDKDDLHEYFKEKYITPVTKYVFNEPVYIMSTADLNTVQFKYLLDSVQYFASTELQIILPDPEDKRWEEFYDYYKDKI
jgi:hypothetical protein